MQASCRKYSPRKSGSRIAVDMHRHERHAQLCLHLCGSQIIQKYIAAVTQHVFRDEHALAELPALKLCN